MASTAGSIGMAGTSAGLTSGSVAGVSAGATNGVMGGMSGSSQGFSGGAAGGAYTGLAGILGSLGYTYLGGAMGLPQSKYSGLTAGIGAAGGYLAGSAIAGSAAAAGSAMATGAAAGSVYPVIGTIIGAIIGGIVGALGGTMGSSSVSYPTISMKYGQGKNTSNNGNGYYNPDYDFGVSTADFGESGHAVRSAMGRQFTSFFKTIEETFSISLKRVFKEHPRTLSFAITTEGADYAKVMTNKFFKAYGLYIAEEIVGPGIMDMFGALGEKTVENAEEYDKAFKNASKKFLDTLRGLRNEKKEPLTDVFARYMQTLDFFPNGTERMQTLLDEGFSQIDAFDKLTEQVEWISKKFMESFKSLTITAMDTKDFKGDEAFKHFSEGFSATLQSVIAEGFNSIQYNDFSDMFLEAFGDPLIKVRDLIEEFSKGELTQGGFLSNLATTFADLQANYTAMEPALEDVSDTYEAFTKWLEDLLGITQTKKEAQTKELEDFIKYHGDEGGYKKAMNDLNEWLKAQVQMAAQYGTDIKLVEDAYLLKREDLVESYSNEITETWESMLEEIKDLYDRIKYSSLNVALPKEKAAMADKDYQDLLLGAKTGDEEKIRKYLDFAEEYLQMQQDVYKSSTQYQDIYASVMNDIMNIQQTANTELEDAKSVMQEAVKSTVDIYNMYIEQLDIIAQQQAKLIESINNQINTLPALEDIIGDDIISPSHRNTQNRQDAANILMEGYADGGISKGPTSGYPAMLHGTEAVIPLSKGYVPVEITGGSNQAPIYVTVEVAGEEFEAMIDRRADNVRVKANKRKNMNERRAIY
jgi:hypothetical protein